LGLYLDNNPQAVLVQNNVFYFTGCWVFINTGRGGNTLLNNHHQFIEAYDRGKIPSVVRGTQVFDPLNPNAAQLAVIEKAGLEEAYADLRGGTGRYALVPIDKAKLANIFGDEGTEQLLSANAPVTGFNGNKITGITDGDLSLVWDGNMPAGNDFFVIDLGEELAQDFLSQHVGTVQRILLEEREGEFWTGYTDNYVKAYVPAAKDRDGSYLDLANTFFEGTVRRADGKGIYL